MESKHQTLQGLAFPLQPEAQRALQQLRQKAINYIQLVGAAPRPAPARAPPGPGPHPAPFYACADAHARPAALCTVVPVYRWGHAVHPPCPGPACSRLTCSCRVSWMLSVQGTCKRCPSFCPPRCLYVLTPGFTPTPQP